MVASQHSVMHEIPRRVERRSCDLVRRRRTSSRTFKFLFVSSPTGPSSVVVLIIHPLYSLSLPPLSQQIGPLPLRLAHELGDMRLELNNTFVIPEQPDVIPSGRPRSCSAPIQPEPEPEPGCTGACRVYGVCTIPVIGVVLACHW